MTFTKKKSDNPHISYRYLGYHLQLDPGFLLKVLQGKLHLAERSIPRVCTFLKFNEQESRYFEMLVCYNKAAKDSENGSNSIKDRTSHRYNGTPNATMSS